MRSFTVSLGRNYEQLNAVYFSILRYFIQLDPVIQESAAGKVFSAQMKEFLKNSFDASAESVEFLFGINEQGNVEIRIKDNGITKIPAEKLGKYEWRYVLFTQSSKKNLSTDKKQLGGRQLGIAIGAFFLDTRAQDGSISLLQNTDTPGATVLITSSQLNYDHLIVQEEMENITFKMIQYAEKEGSLYRYATAIAMQEREKYQRVIAEKRGGSLDDDDDLALFMAEQALQKTVHETTVEVIKAMKERHRYFEQQLRRESIESRSRRSSIESRSRRASIESRFSSTDVILTFAPETLQNDLPASEIQEIKAKTSRLTPSPLPSLRTPKTPIRSVSSFSSVPRTAAHVHMIKQLKTDAIIHSPSEKTSSTITLPPLSYRFGFFPVRRKITHQNRTKSAVNVLKCELSAK